MVGISDYYDQKGDGIQLLCKQLWISKFFSGMYVYPLTEEELKQMAKYICHQKKLPSTFPENITEFESEIHFSKHLVPAETVCRECPDQFSDLPQHSLALDVRTRWSSLYLMVERFVEQYAAVQATTTDPQSKPSAERKRLETLSDDHRKAEFVRIMKPLHTSLLCVSADKSPTCSQIFPILIKLEAHFETQDEDSLFTAMLKEKVWGDLSTCYKGGESSAMDPRFKNRIDSDEIWYAVRVKTHNKTQVSKQEESNADDVSEQKDKEPFSIQYSDETPFPKRPRLTALEELSEEEDRALKSSAAVEKTSSIPERVQRETQLYRNLPAVLTSEDALAW